MTIDYYPTQTVRTPGGIGKVVEFGRGGDNRAMVKVQFDEKAVWYETALITSRL